MMSKHGKSVRTSWTLPDGAQKTVDTDTGSSQGCRKVRFTFVGHRQRSGLWVSMCMLHQTIIGYHVMPNGEGRRDAIYPVYRFLEKPPVAMFGDYACGNEETCLNYLSHYFKGVGFYHDIFHGCSHVCSERFCSRRLAAFAVLNTSLMEQVRFRIFATTSSFHIVNVQFILYICRMQMNSFLQPLRGILKSGLTKVTTFHLE
jgi:hypothetical protein